MKIPELKLPLKKRKPIRKLGKKGLAWIQERNQWFIDHPATAFKCHYCRKWMDKQNTTLDHENNRNHPGRIFPCCYWCNSKKGSVSHDKFVKENYPNHVCVDV